MTTEYRIGNFIALNIEGNRQIHKIICIDENSISAENIIDGSKFHGMRPESKGIILTLEILEKCGFIDRSGTLANRQGFGLTMFETLELVWYIQDGFLRYQTKGSGWSHSFEHIKHVHQLQNLYFALTGKELKIKL